MIKILRETHEAPASVARRLEIAGGRNRFGQPNYRAVWGWSRLGWIGGKWADRDAEGTLIREAMCLRQVPKYTPHDRWHIERWVAPETYGSPCEWYAQTMERESNGSGGAAVPALGPYPTQGEYEHCFTLEGPSGEFVQLTPTVAEYVARAIEAGRHISASQRRVAIGAREEKSERDYDAWSWDVLSSDDRAFNAQPFTTVL